MDHTVMGTQEVVRVLVHTRNALHDDDGRKPKVKIPPPVFKGLPGERPDAHLLAAADWMEAMRLKPHDFIDNFKHTLQHLAHESFAAWTQIRSHVAV